MRRLIWNIKNLWYWIPKLWNNYDFDSYYLMEVILHKLRRMQPAFESGYCVGSDAIAVVISNLIEIGERIQKDDYYDVEYCEGLSEESKKKYLDKIHQEREEDIDAFFKILKTEFDGMWD